MNGRGISKSSRGSKKRRWICIRPCATRIYRSARRQSGNERSPVCFVCFVGLVCLVLNEKNQMNQIDQTDVFIGSRPVPGRLPQRRRWLAPVVRTGGLPTSGHESAPDLPAPPDN